MSMGAGPAGQTVLHEDDADFLHLKFMLLLQICVRSVLASLRLGSPEHPTVSKYHHNHGDSSRACVDPETGLDPHPRA